MQTNTAKVAPALRALVENLFDYAGTFPPAGLDVQSAARNYEAYQRNEYAWMLRYMVISSADLEHVQPSLDGNLSVLAEKDDARAAAIETKSEVQAGGKPVYWEVTPGVEGDLDRIKAAGCFAKIRTGSVKPDGIPSTEAVAEFISECAQRKLAFKATAGLHHPIRAEYALTYEKDAPQAVMHGFLNVMVASAFAWHGELDIEPILQETDAHKFEFGDELKWNGKALSAEEVKAARKDFMHAIGSCSFDEPVQELKALGLLP